MCNIWDFTKYYPWAFCFNVNIPSPEGTVPRAIKSSKGWVPSLSFYHFTSSKIHIKIQVACPSHNLSFGKNGLQSYLSQNLLVYFLPRLFILRHSHKADGFESSFHCTSFLSSKKVKAGQGLHHRERSNSNNNLKILSITLFQCRKFSPEVIV